MNLRQNFEAVLQRLRTDLIIDLNRTNVLNRAKMEALQSEYNAKLVNVQADFLNMLGSSDARISVEFDLPDVKSLEDFGKISFTGLAAGGVAYTTLTFVTLGVPQIITSTSWIFWTVSTVTVTKISLASWLAALVGISSGLATAIVTGGVGVIAAAGVYIALFPVWRRKARKKLLEDFDKTVIPLLKEWADKAARRRPLGFY